MKKVSKTCLYNGKKLLRWPARIQFPGISVSPAGITFQERALVRKPYDIKKITAKTAVT